MPSDKTVASEIVHALPCMGLQVRMPAASAEALAVVDPRCKPHGHTGHNTSNTSLEGGETELVVGVEDLHGEVLQATRMKSHFVPLEGQGHSWSALTTEHQWCVPLQTRHVGTPVEQALREGLSHNLTGEAHLQQEPDSWFCDRLQCCRGVLTQSLLHCFAWTELERNMGAQREDLEGNHATTVDESCILKGGTIGE